MNKIVAKDEEHLKSLIQEEIEKNGPNCNLNHIDVSNVTNMYAMFRNSQFNGDISKWDVSNVTDVRYMFKNTNNPTRFKWNFEKLLMVNRDEIDFNSFREIIVSMYE